MTETGTSAAGIERSGEGDSSGGQRGVHVDHGQGHSSAEDTGEPEPGLASHGLHIGSLVADVEWGEHASALSEWRQGHLVSNVPLSWIAPAGVDPMTGQDHESGQAAPFFLAEGAPAIVCSQTCDLGGKPPGSHHPFVQVAPLVHGSLLNGGLRSAALKWRVRYLVPVNSPFNSILEKKPYPWFADLRLISPISKAFLLDRSPIEGFPSEESYQTFAEVLGYKFQRPALHDGLSEDISNLLNDWARNQGKSKPHIAKVEHVRVLIVEGTPRFPTRATFFVISDGVTWTDPERAIWDQFSAKATSLLKKHGINVTLQCLEISEMKADLYRRSVPVPSDVLGAPGFP